MTTVKDTVPYTLPTSDTNQEFDSYPVKDSNGKKMTVKSGTTYNVDRIYLNVTDKSGKTPNCYWYRVVINGTYSYIYAGDCSKDVTANPTVKLTGANAPGTLDLRQSFSIKGTIKSSGEYITRVKVAIQKSGTDKQKKEVTFKESSKTTSYDISKLDSGLKFGDLSSGNYTYKVAYSALYYYCTGGKYNDGKNLTHWTYSGDLKSTDFKVQVNQATVDKFMNNCVKVSTSIKVKATADGWLWSMPCINDSCDQSYGVKQYKSGDTFTADMIYDNHKNLKDEDTPHYWYRVKNGNSYAYIWAGNCEKTGCISDVKLSGESKPTQLVKGEDFAVKGTVKTTNSFIGQIQIYVRDSSGNAVTSEGVQFQSDKMSSSVKEYDLSNLDSKLDFQNLKAGTYTYAVQCATVYYYCADSKTLTWSYGSPPLPYLLEQEFTVHEHSYTSKVVPATCTSKGYTEYSCACGDSYKENYIDALGHNTTMKNSKDATCTSDGYSGDKVCTSCGKTISKGETVAALGHNYSSGYCTRCGAQDPDYEAPHNHSYTSEVTEPTCTEAGYTTYNCSCGASYKDNYVNALGHNYENGECTRCGDKDPNYQPTHTHDTELKNAKDATCTEAGYTGDEVCKTCDETVKKGTEIAALGHDYKDGVCTRCGEKDQNASTDTGYSWTAANGVSYTIDNGVLTISGKGSFSHDWYTNFEDSVRAEVVKVVIEAGVKDFRYNTLVHCSALTEITVSPENASCSSLDGVLYNKDQTEIIACPPTRSGSFTIPNGVTDIAMYAFCFCKSITSVTIPDGVTKIHSSVFHTCKSMTSITIPDSVTNIYGYVFKDCESLTDIYYGGSQEQWDAMDIESDGNTVTLESARIHYNSASYTHTDTKTYTDPTCTERGYTTYTCACGSSYKADYERALGHDYKDGVCARCGEKDPNASTDTGNSYENGGITYTLNNGTLTISGSGECIPGWENKLDKTSVKKVVIQEGITKITGSVFYNCTALTDVTIPESVTSIGDNAFSGCTALTDIIIPEGVTLIDYKAFSDCSALKSVALPASLTEVSEYAFIRCDALTDVYYGGTQEQWKAISIGTENDCLTNATIHYNGEPETLPGDINGDGEVNILDLVRLKKVIAGVDVEVIGSADVNGDGEVNILDLIRLKKFIAGVDVVLN